MPLLQRRELLQRQRVDLAELVQQRCAACGPSLLRGPVVRGCGSVPPRRGGRRTGTAGPYSADQARPLTANSSTARAAICSSRIRRARPGRSPPRGRCLTTLSSSADRSRTRARTSLSSSAAPAGLLGRRCGRRRAADERLLGPARWPAGAVRHGPGHGGFGGAAAAPGRGPLAGLPLGRGRGVQRVGAARRWPAAAPRRSAPPAGRPSRRCGPSCTAGQRVLDRGGAARRPRPRPGQRVRIRAVRAGRVSLGLGLGQLAAQLGQPGLVLLPGPAAAAMAVGQPAHLVTRRRGRRRPGCPAGRRSRPPPESACLQSGPGPRPTACRAAASASSAPGESRSARWQAAQLRAGRRRRRCAAARMLQQALLPRPTRRAPSARRAGRRPG